MKLASRIIPVEKRSIAPRESIEFQVPLPPPLNSLFANVPGKGRVKTGRYRAWIKEAGWSILAARVGHIDGPVSVKITLPNTARGDTDAYAKATLDLCVRHGLIEDDRGRIIRSLTMDFGDVDGAKVVIRRAA